jgi:hypothetical protein
MAQTLREVVATFKLDADDRQVGSSRGAPPNPAKRPAVASVSARRSAVGPRR